MESDALSRERRTLIPPVTSDDENNHELQYCLLRVAAVGFSHEAGRRFQHISDGCTRGLRDE